MQSMRGLDELREQGGMTWVQAAQGGLAALDDVVAALSKDGFEECARETTSRRDPRPADGAWQGVNPSTGSVASATWVNQRRGARAMVLIAIDGQPLRGHASRSLERDPYMDDGGES
jgi:hypothetical protein